MVIQDVDTGLSGEEQNGRLCDVDKLSGRLSRIFGLQDARVIG